MLPGTGPDTGTVVVTGAGLPCCAFVHPARNTVKTRVQAQRTRRSDRVIFFTGCLLFRATKKNLVMMTKPMKLHPFLARTRPVPLRISTHGVSAAPQPGLAGILPPTFTLGSPLFLSLQQYPYSGTPMLPQVILHTAMSLDGRITGFPADLDIYYSLAAQWNPDAILFGSETVLAAVRDNPLLEIPPEH
jgi:hypothetical protein